MILTEQPAPFSGYKTIHTLFPDHADVPEMCISVNRYKKHEFFHVSGSLHPAARDLFFLAALPDLTDRRTTAIPATPRTPELHHGTGQVIALLVLFKGLSMGAFEMASAISRIVPAAVPCGDPGRGPRSSPCVRGCQGSRDHNKVRDSSSIYAGYPDAP